MTCKACDDFARSPISGVYFAHCVDCQARMLAQGPWFYEAVRANAITPRYRTALQSVFGEAWKAGHELVRKWAARIGII
jgi:hypothetical protein